MGFAAILWTLLTSKNLCGGRGLNCLKISFAIHGSAQVLFLADSTGFIIFVTFLFSDLP